MSDTSIRVIYHAMSLTVLYDWKRSHLLIIQNSPEKNSPYVRHDVQVQGIFNAPNVTPF